MEEISLAVKDLEGFARPEILEYIKYVTGYNDKEALEEIRKTSQLDNTSSSSSSIRLDFKDGQFSKTEADIFFEVGPLQAPVQVKVTGYKPNGFVNNSPPLLCSKLPICKKISHRTTKLVWPRTPSPSSEVEEERELESSLVAEPFDEIVGKINPRLPKKFDRGRKVHKNPFDGGVREYSKTISNPLYKNYNPKGYVKNDDELAVEFIQKVTRVFNTWLSKFDGELVQVDVDMMVKTIRSDLELSFCQKSS